MTSKRREPKYVRLSEAKDSHSHKMWTEVSSSVTHFLFSDREPARLFNTTRGMPRIMKFRSTTDRIYDGGPIIMLYYHCVTITYSIQYSNMLYRFVA